MTIYFLLGGGICVGGVHVLVYGVYVIVYVCSPCMWDHMLV